MIILVDIIVTTSNDGDPFVQVVVYVMTLFEHNVYVEKCSDIMCSVASNVRCCDIVRSYCYVCAVLYTKELHNDKSNRRYHMLIQCIVYNCCTYEKLIKCTHCRIFIICSLVCIFTMLEHLQLFYSNIV